MRLFDGTLIYEDIIRQACVEGCAILVWVGNRRGLMLEGYRGGYAGGNMELLPSSSIAISIPTVEVALRVANEQDVSFPRSNIIT